MGRRVGLLKTDTVAHIAHCVIFYCFTLYAILKYFYILKLEFGHTCSSTFRYYRGQTDKKCHYVKGICIYFHDLQLVTATAIT